MADRSRLPNMRRERLRPPVAAHDGEDNTGWLVTFSDLVLQLFAFVIVASVMGGAQSGPTAPTSAAVSEPAPAAGARLALARSVAPAERPSEETKPRPPTPAEPEETATAMSPAPEGERVPAARTAPPVAPASARDAAPVADPAAANEPDGTRAADTAEPAPPDALVAAAARLRAAAAALGSDGATVSASADVVVLTMTEAVGFPSGSADLLPGAASLLDEVRRLASALPEVRVEVSGHTDDVPIRSTQFPSNLELSLARAARVVHELIAGDPVLASRIEARGVGEYQPVASNADADGRARNRRVEIRLRRASA